MFLELAEPGLSDCPNLQEYGSLMEDGEIPYLFIPGVPGEEGVYIREDHFDDLPDEQFEELIAYLEGAQQGVGLFGFGRKGRARRAARRAKRHARKLDKISARGAAGTGLEGIFGKVTTGLGKIFGRGEPETGLMPVQQQAGFAPQKPMNWTPFIIGGIAIVIIGGVVMARRKK